MKIYIASSWKNQHAVEMLTDLLRAEGHDVLSFVENNHGEGYTGDGSMAFDEWVETEAARRSFEYDTRGATTADIVIYIAPSGTDAWAEIGAAWATGRCILGLYAKGEPAGLMRKMMTVWCSDHRDILDAVRHYRDCADAVAPDVATDGEGAE
jgi:hypothetical protein